MTQYRAKLPLTDRRARSPRGLLILGLVLLLTPACSPGGEEAAAAAENAREGRVERTLSSAGEHVDDAILHFEVKARLLDELGWAAIGIEVDAVDGRILLTGEVPERSDRELAEEIVRSVDGVRRVESRLELEEDASPDGASAAERVAREAEREVRDGLLEARLKARLLEEIGRHALDLEVEAADGVVTLRGTLDNEAHEQLALETASRTKGVEKVVNLIET
ncbi:MAG: BON domain-containing protein [Acidobacteriota bacterium]|jgi:osmotically-inducible protein OsmY